MTANTATSNRLPTLQDEARQCHEAVRQHIAQAAEQALAAGERLNEAKALCAHGTWADWLKGTGISERSAQRYMRLHRTGFKSAIVADLGFAKCDEYAAAGESLMPPREDRALCLSWRAEDLWAESLAYVWRAGDGLHFAEFVIIEGEGIEIKPKAPVPVWLLGAIFAFHGHKDNALTNDVPIAEALEFVAKLAA